MSQPSLSSLIWSVADLLRGDYRASEFGKVILPFTVLRRLDCALAPTKQTVLDEKAKQEAKGINPESFMLRVSGLRFINTSPLDMKKLMGDQDHLATNLAAYIQGFSPAVAKVAVKPKAPQAELDAAIGPVSNRLLVRFKQAQQTDKAEPDGSNAQKAAKDEMEALLLFKRDLGSYIRIYEFLGQMFDYGNTEYEKLYLFSRMLLPLLEFGRERDGIDLSALRLSHHKMRDLGQQKLNLGGGEPPPLLAPITDIGSGRVQEKHKARLNEIIQAINDLFVGEITEGDTVAYVDSVLKTKMLESATLRAQAAANTKEQFSNSPSLSEELQNAIMDAMAAHESMSKQALNSDTIQARILSVLLGPGGLWEALRGNAPAASSAVA